MSATDKVTVNLNVVDLGKMDILVEQGYYSNRTDFIKNAVRNNLREYESDVQRLATKTSSSLGIIFYNRKDLLKMKEEKRKIRLNVIGMLVLKDDIDGELAKSVFQSIKVSGVFKASLEVRDALESKMGDQA